MGILHDPLIQGLLLIHFVSVGRLLLLLYNAILLFVGTGDPAITFGYLEVFLRGTLAARVYVCRPADPEAKGLVERFHDFLERSWLPGRSFACPADFNAQLAGWIAVANTRWRRHLQCAPADRVAADRAAMVALPPVPPVTGWHRTARLPRDHYVRLDGNDYSVDPAVIGRRVEVTADLHRVQVTCEGRVVADHGRCWARHQTISDPAHLAAAKALRTARRLAAVPVPPGTEVEQRDLAVYDALCGGGQGVA